MTTNLTHVGIHASLNRNAGDTLLFAEVRRLFEQQLGAIDWNRRQLWEHLDVDAALQLNGETDGVVIGGGGLLLRDQAGADASASGWQWNSTVDAVRSLNVPVMVFGIGYNRFRGQADFDPPFADHLQALVETSSFFGLRNKGSIRAVSEYLPSVLAERLTLQPCPTIFLWHLDKNVAPVVIDHARSGRQVLRLNVAFDRPEMRFGLDPEAALSQIAQAMRHAEATGWQVRYTAHKDLDLQFLPYLDALGVDYVVDDLTDSEPGDIVDTYARCDLAVGLRGHAQMIPFGARRPILSIISHDKMQWFLDDVGHPEWGVEVGSKDLCDQLVDRIDVQRTDRDRISAELGAAQDRLWDLTRLNLVDIGARLGSSAPAVSTHNGVASADGAPPSVHMSSKDS